MAERSRRDSSPGALKSQRSILDAEIALADEELERPWPGLLTSGLIAGFGVGVSLLLIAVLLNPLEEAGPALAGVLIGAAYGVGFVIVILSRTDLFTEYTTLAILPVLVGRARVTELARLWVLVFAGNILGAAAFALLIAWLAPALEVTEAETLSRIALEILAADNMVMLVSAVLAGWLMGLLSWLIAAARDMVSQIVFIFLIALVIGAGGLHHSIIGAAEIVAAVPLSAEVAVVDLGRFLWWTTIGNATGGLVFAALIRLGMVAGGARDSSRRSSPSARHR